MYYTYHLIIIVRNNIDVVVMLTFVSFTFVCREEEQARPPHSVDTVEDQARRHPAIRHR